MAGLMNQLDYQLEQLFSAWNFWSTLLIFGVFFTLVYPLLVYREPDTHPLLLSRQSNVSMVRMPGESATYRSLEVPDGLSLRTGLNVRSEGDSKWRIGKDGDVRDVWKRVIDGTLTDDGKRTGHRSNIQTVYGLEEVETHEIADLTKQMNSIGNYIKTHGGTTVAICLPNSVELLLSIFAAAFYGFHPVLIPYDIPQDISLKLISMCGANFAIGEAGAIPLTDIKAKCDSLKHVLWVVEKTSRHMDWDDNDGAISTGTWHDIVHRNASVATEELPTSSETDAVPDIITVWINKTATSGEIVAFTQQNFAAAAAAQASALPMRHRLSHTDIFLPADSMTQPYILTQTLAALYNGVTVALNSVAGSQADLTATAAGISPTIMSASAASALKLREETKSLASGALQSFALNSQKRALASGYMPPSTIGKGVIQPTRATVGKLPNKLRLLYTFERAHSGTPHLTSEVLNDLRAFTGARVIYALIAAKVAGSITQTAFYDYRRGMQSGEVHSHFGAPVSSLEVKLVDTDTHRNIQGQSPTGDVSALVQSCYVRLL